MTIHKYLQWDVYSRSREMTTFFNWDLDRKLEHQNYWLKKTLKYAFDNSPFYRAKYEGIDLTKITLDNLDQLPITRKDELKANNHLNFTRSMNSSDVRMTSGGTSGQPLRYALSRNQYCSFMANLVVIWGQLGFQVGDRLGYLDNEALKKGKMQQIKNILRKIYPVSMYHIRKENIEESLEFYRKSRIEWLRIVPTAAMDFILLLKENGIDQADIKDLKGIYSTGEMLYDFQRKKIEQFFGVPISDQYGSGDGGQCAFQIPQISPYYLCDMYRSIFEIVDGKVIGTTIDPCPLFPFIRYEVGDQAEFCNPKYIGNHQVVKSIKGRSFQSIILSNGRRINGLYFVHMLDGVQDRVRQFEFVQKTSKTMKVQIQLFNYNDKEIVKNYLFNVMEKEIQELLELELEFKDFDQNNDRKFLYVKREF